MLQSVSMGPAVPSLTPPAARRSRLENLSDAVEVSKDLKDEVLDPLKTPIALSGRSVEGLGVTGSAVGGVHGLKTIIDGVKERNTPQVVAGATEVTTAAGSLAALGFIGGAPVLAPLGAGLLLIRGAHRIQEGAVTDKRIDGVEDLITAGAITSTMMHAPLGVTLTLGLVAGGWSALQGLHRLHEGHETKDATLKIRGTGQLAASLGIAAISTQMAVAPGVALVLAGASLGLIQRVPTLRPYVDRLVSGAEKVLAPVAAHSDKIVARTLDTLQPVLATASKTAGRLHDAASPVLGPVERVGARVRDSAMARTADALERASEWKIFQAADRAVGAMRDMLLPEPSSRPPDTTLEAR